MLLLPQSCVPTPLIYRATLDEIIATEFNTTEAVILRHNVGYYARRIVPQWTVTIQPKEDDNDEDYTPLPGILTTDYTAARYRQYISVFIGKERVLLTDIQRARLEHIIGVCWDNHRDAYAVFDMNQRLVYREVTMSREWLQHIIPHILAPGEYISDNIVFTRGDAKEFDDIYLAFITRLARFYLRGSVALPAVSHLIDAYHLEEGAVSGVWHPRWINTLVAPDPSEFLLAIANGVTTHTVDLPAVVTVRKREAVTGYTPSKTHATISGNTYEELALAARQLY